VANGSERGCGGDGNGTRRDALPRFMKGWRRVEYEPTCASGGTINTLTKIEQNVLRPDSWHNMSLSLHAAIFVRKMSLILGAYPLGVR
jgi:hypothetical protein